MMCRPGYYTTSDGSCSPCTCGTNEYQSSTQQCLTGRDTVKASCSLCGRLCSPGQYVANSTICDGSQTYNPAQCVDCSIRTCPSAAAQQQCPELDCIRGQAFAYPFDGWDITFDLGPRRAHLIPISASSRSSGPSVAIIINEEKVAAFFNASNHEYFAIPPLSLSGREMTLVFRIRFASFSTPFSLLEIGNGYSTENIYVRFASSSLIFGVSHTFQQREVAVPVLPQNNWWLHVAWTMEHTNWSIFLNGTAVLDRVAVGIPLPSSKTTYSFNYIGFGSDPALFSSGSFFTGNVNANMH